MNSDQLPDDAPARVIWMFDGMERSRELEPAMSPLVIGRSSRAHVRIAGERASRRHAEIYWDGRRWWLRDAGSHNGTYIDTISIARPVPLAHGDRIRCGETSIGFLWPAARRMATGSSQPETVSAPTPPHLTAADKQLLRELCRDYWSGADPRSRGSRSPPTNSEIADRLTVTEAAVRQRLKRLYPKLGLTGSEATKRTELIARAIEIGAIADWKP